MPRSIRGFFGNIGALRGRAAAEILIAQQQKGLEMLVARGVLVKVNSVMIPGVNDEHLKEVSRIVKAKGVFLHNVMPLIAEPEHGTYYGLSRQRSPTAQELKDLQDACAGDMTMMRHCRQCRADAVGLLGEDRGAEFALAEVEAMGGEPRCGTGPSSGFARRSASRVGGEACVGCARCAACVLVLCFAGDRLAPSAPQAARQAGTDGRSDQGRQDGQQAFPVMPVNSSCMRPARPAFVLVWPSQDRQVLWRQRYLR